MTPQPDLQNRFKSAMRRVASSVAIVSMFHGGKRYGMTITAFNSLSIEPLALMIAINRQAALHGVLMKRSAALICVNLLDPSHEEAANAFAGRVEREARFEYGRWVQKDGEIPYLIDAQCNLFCSVEASLSYGSHSVFVGNVQDVLIEGSYKPLLYGDGRYARIDGGV